MNNDVVIEGHTDGLPYSKGLITNWELSAERANAARRIMTAAGLRDKQVRAVRGFADQDLRVKTDPTDARNRRVSIVVRTHSAAELENAVRAQSAAIGR
jgi:chemotaxis protein MotB